MTTRHAVPSASERAETTSMSLCNASADFLTFGEFCIEHGHLISSSCGVAVLVRLRICKKLPQPVSQNSSVVSVTLCVCLQLREDQVALWRNQTLWCHPWAAVWTGELASGLHTGIRLARATDTRWATAFANLWHLATSLFPAVFNDSACRVIISTLCVPWVRWIHKRTARMRWLPELQFSLAPLWAAPDRDHRSHASGLGK